MKELTHFDENGRAHMVNVSDKKITHRIAVTYGEISMQPETLKLIQEGKMKKGDVLAVAQVAGIMAAKKTWELIPMCHAIPITAIDLTFTPDEQKSSITIRAKVSADWKTGVEMEALTAVSTAALTIYDMCKAVDRGMRIENIHLVEKDGGRSGHFVQEEQEPV